MPLCQECVDPDMVPEERAEVENPSPRCGRRCNYGYWSPFWCTRWCRRAKYHRGACDCLQHERRPKRPPPRPPTPPPPHTAEWISRLVWTGNDDGEKEQPVALVAQNGTKSQVPDLPVVDPKTSPHLWAVVDTACNTSVCSEGWIEKGKKIWEGYGYRPIRTSNRTGPYGGLAGDATAQMVGKISFPVGYYRRSK